MRARPGVAEGQDVAAQQREAGADQCESHDRAGEPREGGPGPSGAKSNHSGRNIDAKGRSLKSQEWAKFARRKPDLLVLIAILGVCGTRTWRVDARTTHSWSPSSNMRRAVPHYPLSGDPRPLDVAKSCSCASHAAGRRPRWPSPSSPCSWPSAGPPRPRNSCSTAPASQQHGHRQGHQERLGRQGGPDQGCGALVDGHTGALGGLGADRRRAGARSRSGRRIRGPDAARRRWRDGVEARPGLDRRWFGGERFAADGRHRVVHGQCQRRLRPVRRASNAARWPRPRRCRPAVSPTSPTTSSRSRRPRGGRTSSS